MVRTRIAPSPTGKPHIGTIYQALFDFAFARRNKGKFIVRIEDTDRVRFVEGAEENIYRALDWFGLIEDEGPRKGGQYAPYRQSERLEIYQKYAKELVEKEKAYYCFCSKERLEEVRNKMQEEKKLVMYDKHCRNLPKEEVQKNLKNNLSYVIRLRVPENKKIVVKDEIRGDVIFDSNTVDDQVIIKSDGFPTYHLAATVDDHLMEITHVIRGEEWLTSAPKHILLYDYLGWEKPLFYHTPDLRNADKSKLSKRHGHTDVDWYKEQGFLPEAILNFLALLGWTHPEEKEIFSLVEFIDLFDPKDLKAIGPIFDIKKLEWMNAMYIRKSQISNLKFQILELKPELKNIENDLLDQLIPVAQTRMTTLNDFFELTKFIFEDIKVGLSSKEKEVSKRLLDNLSAIEVWDNEAIFTVIKKVTDKESIKLQLIYKILTGKESGLPLSQTLEVIGKEKTLEIINKRQ